MHSAAPTAFTGTPARPARPPPSPTRPQGNQSLHLATEASPVFLSQEGGAGGGQGTGWRVLEGLLGERLASWPRVKKKERKPSSLPCSAVCPRPSVGAWTAPGPPPAPEAQTKESAADQEVRGWEIPGPPDSTLFPYQLLSKSRWRGDRK